MLRMTGAKGKFSVEPLCFNVPMRIFTRIGICHLSPPSQNPRFPRATAAPPPPLSPLILPPASQKLHQWEAHIMLSPPV